MSVDLFLKKYGDYLFLLLLLSSLIVFKFPHLSLPFFWDEAWSYAPAVDAMANTFPSLLPGKIDAELSRGHPLFFYFSAGLWLKVFGIHLFSAHSFALLISCLTLFALFRLSCQFMSKSGAIFTTSLFSVQTIFLAQSCLLLPELMLTLFTILTLKAYLSNKWKAYLLFSTLLLFTKESGIVLIGTILFFEFFKQVFSKERNIISIINKFGKLSFPILIIGLFFILQKFKMGWYFFPEHTNLISFEQKDIYHKLYSYSKFLFLDQGRNLILFSTIALSIPLIIRKVKINQNQIKLLLFSTLFLLFYLVFLVLNFHSLRYILCITPCFLIICTIIIWSNLKKYPILKYSFSSLLIIVSIFMGFSNKGDNDQNLGYVDAVIVHNKLINFCEEQSLHEAPIFTNFIIGRYLKNPIAGYLNSEKTFSNIQKKMNNKTQYVILTSAAPMRTLTRIYQERKMVPLAEYQQGNSWGRIYKIRD